MYNPQYDAESRLTAVSGSATASFVFDGDGNRVKSTAGGVTTVHIGAYFEWTGSTSTMKTYYSAGGARVAVRTGSSTLSFILSDHLGSTSVTTDSGGVLSTDNRYKTWGESRYASGTLPTKFTYTGQYSNVTDFGLMFYGARWYDNYLNYAVFLAKIEHLCYNRYCCVLCCWLPAISRACILTPLADDCFS